MHESYRVIRVPTVQKRCKLVVQKSISGLRRPREKDPLAYLKEKKACGEANSLLQLISQVKYAVCQTGQENEPLLADSKNRLFLGLGKGLSDKAIL